MQGEALVFLVQLPVLKTPVGQHDYRLVDYLVRENYWRPREVEEPRWWLMSHWNSQWRDGQAALHKELAWRAKDWIEWTESNPEFARVFWPYLLEVIRSDRLTQEEIEWVAPTVCYLVRLSDDLESFRKVVDENEDLAEVRGRLPVFNP